MAGTLGRIAIVGSGAVGAYYGARLAHAGEDVRFLMRRDLAAVRARGLEVRVFAAQQPRERFHLSRVAAFGTTEEIGPVDLVIVGLKATADATMAELLPALLHERTAVLTLQNGLGSDELVGRLFGAERVLGGLCFVCLNRVGGSADVPAIECYHAGTVSLGELGRPATARTHAIGAAFQRAGVKCTVADNLAEIRWRKLVWNIPFNGLSIAAGGITTDRILADPALLAEVRALMREVQAAAAAVLGVAIPDEFLQKQVDVTGPMGAYRPSSLIDYLDGKAVEVEAIWGEPLRRARAAGVATPHLERLYARLRELCAVR
ncbi:MAG: 2-dehydropantoate 2-reductase [Opitutaceae bacterium]|nr:2-dehydropantoate 2-reductase [Opitutaceae bacterium]